MRNLGLGAALTLGALGLGACQSSSDPADPAPVVEDEPQTPTGALVATPPRELGSPVSAALLAFAEDSNGFRAGYLTHSVTVSEGMIDVVPKHYDLVARKHVVGGAIGLQTTGVFSGGERIDDGTGPQARRDATSILISRGAVIEEITNREDGIEQAWHFAARPASEGDLTVEVGVASQQFVVANDSGLHFKSPAGLGIRYSHAIWRDADGTAFDVPARFEDGRILITVPQDVVQTSAYPAVLDPTITAELFTDTPVNGTTGANNRNQDIASDGTNYFVVWQDQRDSRNDDIFGARVTAAGAITDTVGIRINAATGTQQNPVVASVGTGYVVAWENVVAAGNTDILAAFVSTAGAVTQLGTVAGTASDETGPAIARRGTQALLVWSNGTGGVSGKVFSAGAFGTEINVGAGLEPAVAGNPAGDYLVTYSQNVGPGDDNILAQRVAANGALSGTQLVVADDPGIQTQSAAAFNGTNFIVVWSTVSADIAAARVSAAGVTLDTTPVTISAATNSQVEPDVACLTASCLISWQDSRNAATSVRDVFGALVTSALAITLNDIVISGAPHAQDTPALAATASGYFATWSDNRDLETIYTRGSRVTAAGGVQDANGIILARALSRYQAPTIAQSTSFTDVFMAETQNPDVNIVHVRFNTAGAQADNPPKVVSSAAGAQLSPSAAFVGGNSMVVWHDTRNLERDIFAARVNIATGATLDPTGIVISNATADQFVPRIASSGNSALVVWQDRRNGAANGFDIYAAVVASSGAITLNNIAICTGPGDQGGPAVAYDATNNQFLVVWTDPSGATVDIRGARLSAAGALLDGNCGIAISAAPGSQFGADVTFGSGRFMVVWEDRRNDAVLGDIYGARVTATGALTVLDPAGIEISRVAGSAQTSPSVAFGTAYAGSYLVAWTDARNAATTGTDIFGSQVSTASGAAGPSFAISAVAGNEGGVRLAPGASSYPFNVAYNKQNIALGTTRMQFRRVALGTVGGQPCSTGTQCESGFCSDGRCCNSACGGTVTNDCQACSAARGASADGVCTTIPASLQYICRDYAIRTDTPQCDVREYCNGISTACPADIGQNGGAVCKKANNVMGLCPPATAAGAPHFCQ